MTQQTSMAFVEAQHKAAAQAQLLGASGMYLRDLDLKSFQNKPVVGVYAQQFRQLGNLLVCCRHKKSSFLKQKRV